MKLRTNRSRRLQKRPIKPKPEDPTQNLRTKKKYQNAAFGKRRSSGARDQHRPPVVFTTARGGGGTTVRPLLPPAASVSFVPFHFRMRFFRFFPFKR